MPILLLAQDDARRQIDEWNEFALDYQSKETEKSDSFARLALNKAIESNYADGELIALSRIGNINLKRGRYDSSLIYLERALKLCDRLPKTEAHLLKKSQILRSFGNVHIWQKNWDQGLQFYEKALNLAEENGLKRGVAEAHYSIASALGRRGFDENGLEQASSSIEEAKSLFTQINDQMMLAECTNLQSNMALAKGDFQSMLSYSLSAVKQFKSLEKDVSLSAAYLNVGSAYWNLGELDKAKENYSLSADLAEKYELNNTQMQAIQYLSDVYREEGDFENAIRFQDSSVKINAQIYSQQRDQTIDEVTARYKVDLLTQERRIERQNALIFIGILVGSLLILSIGYFAIRRSRKNIAKEKARSDELLLNILPQKVADELKSEGKTEPRFYREATVFFADVENFTGVAEKLKATQIIELLDTYFSVFDQELGKEGLEKIKTIGDAYMAACGVPEPKSDHAQRTVRASINLQKRLSELNIKRKEEEKPFLSFRIGIHSGPVVAGVVGSKKFQYDIWGDAVNTAARMESASEQGRINISERTYELVKNDFKCVYRGKIPAKNKGEIDMYFVYSKNSSFMTKRKYEEFKSDLTAMLAEKLDENLFYHGFHHTTYVLKVAEEIALYEGVSEDGIELLKTAVLLHDSGFVRTYKDHEEAGCEIAAEMLPNYNYSPEDIKSIQGMIMATKIPQSPTNLLENIMADADLEYLGTESFDITSDTLLKEWRAYHMIDSHDDWMNAQINFISKHTYFTDFCKKFRTDKKLANLNSLIDANS